MSWSLDNQKLINRRMWYRTNTVINNYRKCPCRSFMFIKIQHGCCCYCGKGAVIDLILFPWFPWEYLLMTFIRQWLFGLEIYSKMSPVTLHHLWCLQNQNWLRLYIHVQSGPMFVIGSVERLHISICSGRSFMTQEQRY